MTTKFLATFSAMTALIAPTIAFAAPVNVSIQNRLANDQIDVDNVQSCNTISPALGSVLAQTTSQNSYTDCGSSTYMTFDYTAPNGKKCGFFAGSYFSTNGFQPQGSAKSKGSVKASCKLILYGSSNGAFAFLATME